MCEIFEIGLKDTEEWGKIDMINENLHRKSCFAARKNEKHDFL